MRQGQSRALTQVFMTFSALDKISLDEIVNVFNRAFADYAIRVKISKSQLEQRIKAENIDLGYSVGAFSGGRLVGFVLHAFDYLRGDKVLYNGGTGVLPEFRGNGITEQMYAFVMPRLHADGITKCYLEVIDTNNKAIHVYMKIGFQINRDLSCYRGIVYHQPTSGSKSFRVGLLEKPDWFLFPTFWNASPTWQNSMPAIQRADDLYQTLGLYHDRELIGYGMINAKTGRVPQFGIHPEFRRRGLGRMLFGYLCRMGNSNLSIINVDASDDATHHFLEEIGMKKFVGQYEMTLSLLQ